MDRLIAKPNTEVNGVKFGTLRSEVRKVFEQAAEFKKTKYSRNTTDDFGFCHVFYDEEDRCEAFEIFNCEVQVDDTVIFPGTIKTAKIVLGTFVEECGSWINKEKSIGIYAPNGNIESILFGKSGYYEK